MFDGEDLIRMEREEQAKSSFRKAGQTDFTAGKLERQSTKRIWSEAELLCRGLAIDVITQSKLIGKFRSSLEEDLKTKLMDRQQHRDQTQETEPPEDLKDGAKDGMAVLQEKEVLPE